MILDSSPQVYLEEIPPTPRPKRKRTTTAEPFEQTALTTTGRSQQTQTAQGLATSTFAPHNTPNVASWGTLDPLISELSTVTNGLKRLAQAIDDIVNSSRPEEKETLHKLFKDIPTYLSGLIHGTQGEDNPTKNPRTWASVASKPDQNTIHLAYTTERTNTPPKEDIRILARVPEEHHGWARSLGKFALCDAVSKATGLSQTDILNVHQIPTGFAIKPANKAVRDVLLAKEAEVQNCLRASKIEIPVKWYTYAISNCPIKLPNILGDLIDTEAIIEDEIVTQSGSRPVRLHPSKHSTKFPNPDRQTWIASFLQPVRSFRLFGKSAVARPVEKSPRIERHNPGCQGFHPNRYCSRRQRCENCSSHVDGDKPHPQPCDLPPRCANCYGPFPASHENCPAKPIKKYNVTTQPTIKELKAIRQIGRKAYNEAKPTAYQPNSTTGSQTSTDANTDFTEPQSSQPSRSSSTDQTTHDMEIDTQVEVVQQLEQRETPPLPYGPQPTASGRRSSRNQNIPRKNYSIANAYSDLENEGESSDYTQRPSRTTTISKNCPGQCEKDSPSTNCIPPTLLGG